MTGLNELYFDAAPYSLSEPKAETVCADCQERPVYLDGLCKRCRELRFYQDESRRLHPHSRHTSYPTRGVGETTTVRPEGDPAATGGGP